MPSELARRLAESEGQFLKEADAIRREIDTLSCEDLDQDIENRKADGKTSLEAARESQKALTEWMQGWREEQRRRIAEALLRGIVRNWNIFAAERRER